MSHSIFFVNELLMCGIIYCMTLLVLLASAALNAVFIINVDLILVHSSITTTGANFVHHC